MKFYLLLLSFIIVPVFTGCIDSENNNKLIINRSEIGNSCFLNESISQRQESILVGDSVRKYSLSVPKKLSGEKLPVILAFHGGNEGGFYFPQQPSFERLSNNEKIIIAYPQAKKEINNEGAWQLNTDENKMQDINFIEHLLNYIQEEHCGDPSKTYAIGYSLGSMFTYELACHLSNKFVSIASFAGTMPINPKSCETDKSINIMHIHGKNDQVISYSDSWEWKNWNSVGTMMDIKTLISFWGDKNLCLSKSSQDLSEYSEITYSDCKDNTKVKLFALNKVGHEWPEEINSTSTNEFIWNFLKEN
tara:strand:+ start:95 stop:1009 length:915 start_codon:yes stop_codon:yes gene_type:complete